MTSRVIPRILYSLLRTGSARMAWITEPPWFPVAPNTVMSLDIFVTLTNRDPSMIDQVMHNAMENSEFDYFKTAQS